MSRGCVCLKLAGGLLMYPIQCPAAEHQCVCTTATETNMAMFVFGPSLYIPAECLALEHACVCRKNDPKLCRRAEPHEDCPCTMKHQTKPTRCWYVYRGQTDYYYYTGFGLNHDIRQHNRCHKIPVVLLSALFLQFGQPQVAMIVNQRLMRFGDTKNK